MYAATVNMNFYRQVITKAETYIFLTFMEDLKSFKLNFSATTEWSLTKFETSVALTQTDEALN